MNYFGRRVAFRKKNKKEQIIKRVEENTVNFFNNERLLTGQFEILTKPLLG